MVLKSFAPILWVLFFLAILPTASALPNEGAFPQHHLQRVQYFRGGNLWLGCIFGNSTYGAIHSYQQSNLVITPCMTTEFSSS